MKQITKMTFKIHLLQGAKREFQEGRDGNNNKTMLDVYNLWKCLYLVKNQCGRERARDDRDSRERRLVLDLVCLNSFRTVSDGPLQN